MPVRTLCCPALLALLALACAKGPQSGGAGSYRGVAVSQNQVIGILEVTVSESEKESLPAAGTLKFPSTSIEFTGTLDKSKTRLTLTSSEGHKLVGESRPNIIRGSYTDATGEAPGSFGLLLETSSSSVELFCGSLLRTSPDRSSQDASPAQAIKHLLLAITALPGGDAICVGNNFAWLGGLGTDKDSLGCGLNETTEIQGKVNATDGNEWTTGEHYGSWTVTPCASNGAMGDAGAPAESADAAD